jgi:hypothetical protein
MRSPPAAVIIIILSCSFIIIIVTFFPALPSLRGCFPNAGWFIILSVAGCCRCGVFYHIPFKEKHVKASRERSGAFFFYSQAALALAPSSSRQDSISKQASHEGHKATRNEIFFSLPACRNYIPSFFIAARSH